MPAVCFQVRAIQCHRLWYAICYC